MADTSSYYIEGWLVASVWVRERQRMGQTSNTTEFPDCGSHVCSIFNTVAKLPLYIFVCVVLCKLILGVYYVGVC